MNDVAYSKDFKTKEKNLFNWFNFEPLEKQFTRKPSFGLQILDTLFFIGSLRF